MKAAQPASEAWTRSARVRLEEYGVSRVSRDRCAGRVRVSWPSGSGFVGTAEREDTPQGQLRCAAEATARALEHATGDTVAIDILSVKRMEDFGTVFVVVGLEGAKPKSGNVVSVTRLVGACLSEDPIRGAILAALSATNRLLGGAVKDAILHPTSSRQRGLKSAARRRDLNVKSSKE